MKRTFFLVLIIFLSLFAFISCKKAKDKEVAPLESNSYKVEIEDIMPKSHKWYYFTEDGYSEVTSLLQVPQTNSLPWTEAIRISSANNNSDMENQDEAFAVVNRLGILSFQGDRVTLSKDLTLFSERSAGNLVFVNNKPVFSVYKSAFFNDTMDNPIYQQDTKLHLFLLYYDNLAKISYPIINCNNLSEIENAEVIDYFYDGKKWFCNIKGVENSKIIFDYLEFTPKESLTAITPSKASNALVIEKSSVDTFREVKEFISYKEIPQRINNLLVGFSGEIPFLLELKTAGGSSSRKYHNVVDNTEEEELNAKGIITASWSAVLFEDGTLFIEGALPGKHILRGGKAIAIRLPKLPGGFVYSDFVISGTNLYAAWEESSFYKTSRSGFINVDLEETLYSKIR